MVRNIPFQLLFRVSPRRFKAGIAARVLCLMIVLTIPPNLRAQVGLETIVVTDIAGTKETLSRLEYGDFFDASDAHIYLQEENPLEIILSRSPKRIARIDSTKCKIAVFEHLKDRSLLTVSLDDGTSITGEFPDRSMEIRGKTGLGEVTFDIQKVRSIEFAQFYYWKDQKRISLDRRAADVYLRQTAPKTRKWTIVDGEKTTYSTEFPIWDRWDTQGSVVVYLTRLFRNQYRNQATITAERGNTQVQVEVDDFQSIEFTGRTVNGKPEVNLIKNDGSRFTVALLFKNFSGSDRDRFSGPDPDDMLMWDTPYGHEGISLIPVRKITLKAGS